MKKLKIWFFIGMSFILCSSTGCEDRISEIPKHAESAQEVALAVSNTDLSGDTLSDVESVASTTGTVLNVVSKAAPGIPYLKEAGLVVTIFTTLLGVFAARKQKKVSDNYRDAIESGISKGLDESNADVSVMKEVLDTETKAHFNSSGKHRL